MFDSAYQISFKFQGNIEGKNLATGMCAAVVAKLLSSVTFTVSAHSHAHSCNTGNKNHLLSCLWSPWLFNSTEHKINQTKCLWGPRSTPVYVGVRRVGSDMSVRLCVCVCSCVDGSTITCSWITFLPVCLILFPSSTGLDFLCWELGLFEEAYWARSLEGSQDQPWPTNTSEGSKHTGPNISSITNSLGFTLPRHRGHHRPHAHWVLAVQTNESVHMRGRRKQGHAWAGKEANTVPCSIKHKSTTF